MAPFFGPPGIIYVIERCGSYCWVKVKPLKYSNDITDSKTLDRSHSDNAYLCRCACVYFCDILSEQPAFEQVYNRIHIEGRLEGTKECRRR